MKKTLLALLFVCSLSQAQVQINAYMGQLGGSTESIDGINYRSYNLVTSGALLSESATGNGQTWNFDVTPATAVAYSVTLPTAQELEVYPNATQILTAVSGGQSAQFLMGNSGGNVVGVANPDFTLSYTNPADIGTFPLSATHSNNDIVAGTFEYAGNSGTFTGTFNTSVDASGTLLTYAFTEARPVTRLKTVQNLILTHPVFGNVGTFFQTIYHYYDNDVVTWLWPQFRSTTTAINIPLLNLNDTETVYEMQVQAFLQTPEVTVTNMKLYPNPAQNVLNIESEAAISSISISDLTGKTVMAKQDPGTSIDISQLTSGMYLVRIDSDKGSTTKKLIKN